MSSPAKMVGQKPLALKWIALLSTVRWYNILLTVLAQYISAYSIVIHSGFNIWKLVYDLRLHAIVIASIFSIAAGFIINNFYDFEKDLINRPHATLFNRIISKKTTLNLFILFNLISLLVAFSASFKIGIFFCGFILALWIYSHKLQKMPFIKEFAASILSVTSFFAIVLHFYKFYDFIFIYGVFFMSMIYSRELIKQFQSYVGDLAIHIASVPVMLGLEKAHYFSQFIMALSFFCGLSIVGFYGLKDGNYYILLCLVVIVINIFLMKFQKFKLINIIYKVLLVGGIINILLI
ncbi:MAG: UbiA family prenyltransferase [bacterium]|nr:UbiA family prenyltransferase [bacterium]